MWFVPIKMMTPFYFFPFLQSGKSSISYLQSDLVNICLQKDLLLYVTAFDVFLFGGDIRDDTPKWWA